MTDTQNESGRLPSKDLKTPDDSKSYSVVDAEYHYSPLEIEKLTRMELPVDVNENDYE